MNNKMRGGHFEQEVHETMKEINQSISFDHVLYEEDIEGSIAHTRMLAKQNIITQGEGEQIIKGLEQIKEEIKEGKFIFSKALEDIHMNIESRLKEIIGDVAGKLHTARSRNDQVATDFKLYVRAKIDEILLLIEALKEAFIKRAKENIYTVMPSFTHLQNAQGISLAHYLLSYVEMLSRDKSRLIDCRNRLNECPLGSAALAGTSYNIDRHFVANLLGFDKPTANSLDSVSDRDFAIEFLSTISILSMHLSRFAEEIVIWSSKQFSFIKLSDKFTTGSSIMPQKRNPDAAELVRGKTGRIYGSLMSLLTVMKSLPLAYSKDMQEDKEPVFDACNTIDICLKATIGMVYDMQFNTDKLLEEAENGYTTATDLADFLCQNLDIPFRDSHYIAGQIVKLAELQNCKLNELSLSDMQKIESRITEKVFSVLSIQNSVESRKSYGGTSFERIKELL